MSQHTHDGNCDCGHDHSEHGHSHDHSTHDHGPDCDCGCHHSEAESIVESALVFSKQGTMVFNPPLTGNEALALATERVGTIAEHVAVDGVVLGHIKALLDCEAGKATISFTRLDSPDITQHGNWSGNRDTSSGVLSLNVLSLANTDAPIEKLVEEIFKSK